MSNSIPKPKEFRIQQYFRDQKLQMYWRHYVSGTTPVNAVVIVQYKQATQSLQKSTEVQNTLRYYKITLLNSSASYLLPND